MTGAPRRSNLNQTFSAQAWMCASIVVALLAGHAATLVIPRDDGRSATHVATRDADVTADHVAPVGQNADRYQARIAAKVARGAKRFDEPDKAIEFFLEQRLTPQNRQYPVERLRTAMQSIRNREAGPQRGTLPGGIQGWQSLGPGNVGGRTRAIVIDPVVPDIMYAAGVAGGVWKSVDGGDSWTPTGDTLLNMAVVSLVMDPADRFTLYAGTGEGFFNGDAVRGLGIFKTTDGGQNWTQLDGTVNNVPTGAFYYVNDVVVSPTDSNRVYAGTRFGVWRSTDAGATWQIVLSNPAFDTTNPTSSGTTVGCTDLVIRNDDVTPDVVFAAFGSFSADGLYRTTDGGDTWQLLGTPSDLQVANQGRMALAIAPSDNDTVYVSMADNGFGAPTGTLVNVFRSTDGGDTWSPRVNLSNTLINPWLLSNLSVVACGGGSIISQGWYDNVIAVDPTNPATVWVGGIDLFRSDDGAQNFRIASYWFLDPTSVRYVHADQHALAFHPAYNGTTNQILYSGSDGGLRQTSNAAGSTSLDTCLFGGLTNTGDVQWKSLNNGYGTIQFYHGDSAKDRDLFIGGAQDNGTHRVDSTQTPNSWIEILGGDGGYVQIDVNNSGIVFAETQNFPSIFRSVNNGPFVFAGAGITDTDGLFITPFAMDPSDPDTLYTGGRRPWRSEDGGNSWSRIGPAIAGFGQLSAIGISPTVRNTVYLGFSNGRMFKSTNATATLPSWTEVSAGLPRNAFISSVAVSPATQSTAYCTFSTFGVPHVFRTTDGGVSWQSIDGIAQSGIPDIPAHWVEARPCDPNTLYVGTELGIFVSEDDGTSWTPANTNFPHTVVESLDFQNEDTLVAFTHGRGAFRTLLATCDCNSNGVNDDTDVNTGASDDCNNNGLPDECEADCNGNTVADTCDVSAGTSTDRNGNKVPDECEPDCNSNGRVDQVDISTGASNDCNNNIIPDECEIAQSDCNNNGVPDDCDPDCNNNSIADDCDISAGTSPDCNSNGEPDECDPDCNNNGSPDDCDVSSGTANDCNGNSLPDECDVVTPNGLDDASATNCCQSGHGPDCNDNTVSSCVCALDSFCCNMDWDDLCVSLVETFGCASCTAPFSEDCNANTVPDECESGADCDNNGVFDECDIADGGVSDCNANAVPDSCETDTDLDRVIDPCDGCPMDRFKTQPLHCGCGVRDTDADGDGSFDCAADNGGSGPFDACPNDPAKTDPGGCGCGTVDTPDTDGDGILDCNDLCDNADDGPDRDGDGVPDCADECPDNAEKSLAGDCGCQLAETGDLDRDGVADCVDNCPINGNPDQNDTDGDGLGDGCDGCPNDFNKSAVGLCGCGTPDDDTDGDGIADCVDNCPADANADQVDDDGDGTGNTCDGCPDNANKTDPGVCGCDRGDVDRDFDGVLDCEDSCPDSVPGVAVDATGCATDMAPPASQPIPGDANPNGDGTSTTDGGADNGATSGGNQDASTPDSTGVPACGAMGMGGVVLLLSGLVGMRRRRRSASSQEGR